MIRDDRGQPPRSSRRILRGPPAGWSRQSAPDPDAKLREIEARLQALASPFRTAEVTGQEIIDPRETRMMPTEFFADAQAILRAQLGLAVMPYLP